MRHLLFRCDFAPSKSPWFRVQAAFQTQIVDCEYIMLIYIRNLPGAGAGFMKQHTAIVIYDRAKPNHSFTQIDYSEIDVPLDYSILNNGNLKIDIDPERMMVYVTYIADNAKSLYDKYGLPKTMKFYYANKVVPHHTETSPVSDMFEAGWDLISVTKECDRSVVFSEKTKRESMVDYLIDQPQYECDFSFSLVCWLVILVVIVAIIYFVYANKSISKSSDDRDIKLV